MKAPFITAITTAFIALAPLSHAETNRFVDYAKVTSVTPRYQTFEHRIPEEQCWTETVRRDVRPQRRSATGTIVGGIIGGAIGHAVGHRRSNKKVGAVVGSVLGASIGSDISNKHRSQSHHGSVYEEVERCEMHYSVQTEERLTGYDITYQYRGETYSTRTDEHPGKRMKIAVSISPVR